MENNRALISLRNIDKAYHLGKTTVPALRNVSLSLQRGEFSALMGPSGSGKSTLLNMIGFLDTPDRGRILLGGTDMIGRRDRELALIRRKQIGFIFQFFNLIPICNVFDNIEYPLLGSDISIAMRKAAVLKKLDEVELKGLEKRFPNELSGGQRQRVAIARALVHSPSFLIADEPTANLDSKTGALIIDLIHRLCREHDTTVIMATHDPEIIKRTDRVIHLHDGCITDKQEASG